VTGHSTWNPFIPYSGQTPTTNNFTNNQWASGSGVTYDSAGNQTAISGLSRSFTYDGENRQIQANIGGTITVYAYDGEGRRVQKTVGSMTTNYVYDAQGNLAAEYGGPAATYPGTMYLTVDHLGSTRMLTSSGASVQERMDYTPFGEELTVGIDGRSAPYSTNQYPTASADGTTAKFTSKERDAETGLDFFSARYTSSAQGRFTSPDPLLSSAGVLSPQTWNRYTYGMNNPLSYIDRNGLWPTRIHEEIYDVIFGGILSSRQVRLLKSASWGQDNPIGPGQDPANSNWHSQCTPGQSLDACSAGISSYINSELGRAKTLGDSFGLVDEALTHFGRASHDLADMGSPFHVRGDGTPTTWNGIRGAGGLSHIIGEQLDDEDWGRIGQSIRNVVSGFFAAFPEQAARLLGSPDKAADRAINNFVDRRIHGRLAQHPMSGIEEGAARQCALGNPAACR
jgi:RHS repeat-associated protein